MIGVGVRFALLFALLATLACLAPFSAREPAPTPDTPLIVTATPASTSARSASAGQAKEEQSDLAKPVTIATTPVQQSTEVSSSSPATLPTSSTPSPNARDQEQGEQTLMSAARALRLKHNGDYAGAIAQFQSIIDSYPGSLQAREAMYQLAQCYLLTEQYNQAFKTFSSFSEMYPDDERQTRITFLLAQCYEGLGLTEKAIDNYKKYAAEESALAGYIGHNIGDIYKNSENYQKAIEEYQQVLDIGPPAYLEMGIREKIAASYLLKKDYSTAVARYSDLLSQQTRWTERARLQYQIGVAYKRWGNIAEAEAAFTKTAIDYPRSNHAADALIVLDEMKSSAVDDYQRGIVYYYNWEPDKAITSLQRYIATNPQGEYFIAAHYFLGLSYLRQGKTIEAIVKLSEFAQSYPTSAFADDALWEVAQAQEELSRLQDAVETYRRLETSYPSSSYAESSAFRRGLGYYKMGDLGSAEDCWNKLLLTFPATEEKSKVLFWMGKAALNIGAAERGRQFLQSAASFKSEDYYNRRAKELLAGENEFSVKQAIDLPDPYLLSSEEKTNFERWLASWISPPPPQIETAKLDPKISSDPLFQRGKELLAIGLWSYADQEFYQLRNQFWSDPLSLAQLSLFFRDQNLYHQSVSCATRLLSLSPSTVEESPVLLQRLLYPTYYGDLVAQEAEKANIDPLIFLSMIKQESAFHRYSLSSAEARGLTQVIPSTAREIARGLAKVDFRQTDLYRPMVSIEFGAWYLAQQLKWLQNNTFFAVAAYNGGGGNVMKWNKGDLSYDTDLFVEDIWFSETEAYIKIVYQNYKHYQNIYRR